MVARIDEKKREELNRLRSSGPDYADETKHFMRCEECGQMVDRRRLGDVMHHMEQGHAGIPVQ